MDLWAELRCCKVIRVAAAYLAVAFDEARRTPAFKNLVTELGLVDYWRATGNWGDFCRPLGADDFECS